MKKIIPTIIIIALAGWGVYYFTVRSASQIPIDEVSKGDILTYSNDQYGVVFQYPKSYVLSESEVGTSTVDGHHSIVLIKDEDRVPPVNGEGPTAITLSIYEATSTGAFSEWLGSSASNRQLSASPTASTTLSSEQAVTYTWSGLYEGRTIAALHNNKIYSLSVTYLNPDDENIGVYEVVKKSLILK
jgi:hypothetical protein